MNENIKKILRKVWTILQLPLWCVVTYYLGFIGQKGARLIGTKCIPDKWLNDPAIYTGYRYASFIGMWIVILLFICIFRFNRHILKSLGTGASGNNWKALLIGFLIGGGLNLINALAAILNKDIAIYFDSFKPVSFFIIFICVFIQSSSEELMCRGFLYQKLMKAYNNPAIAIVVNASLFGILHLKNPGVSLLSVLNIIIVGIFFSLLVYYFDSIWCAMAVHTAWNFMQNIVLGLPNSGNVHPYSVFKLYAGSARSSIFYDAAFGVEGTLFGDALFIIACIIVIYLGRKRKK